MADAIRVPEKAALRILDALKALNSRQEATQQVLDIVAETLGAPPGWRLAQDADGLYLAAPAAPPDDEKRGEA